MSFAASGPQVVCLLNISNKLTIFRILLVPVFVLFLVINSFLPAGIIFLVASFTDYLDGKLARLNNEITNFGKFFDPIADKLLTLSAYVYFVKLNLISVIPVIVILAREFLVTVIRLRAYKKDNKMIAANFFGKFKTILQIFSILLFVLFLYFNKNLNLDNTFTQFLFSCSKFFIWISAVFSVVSFITYFGITSSCVLVEKTVH